MNDFDQLGEVLGNFIIPLLTAELDRQDHKMDGNLEKSFEVKVIEEKGEIVVQFFMLKYALSLNYGIPRKKIPYTIGGPPRAKKSKYIQGLIEFAKKKLKATKKNAKNIAFAIAYKHKSKDFPDYPLTGKTKFIDNVLTAEQKKIVSIVQDYFEVSIELLIDDYITFNKAA
jgi:hypothetical protein